MGTVEHEDKLGSNWLFFSEKHKLWDFGRIKIRYGEEPGEEAC